MLRTGGVCGGPGSCDSREEVSQEKGGKIFSKASEKRHRIVCRRRKGLTVAGGSVCRQRRKPVYGRLYIGRTGQNQPGPAGKGGSALKGVSSCPGNTLKQRMRCGDAKRDCLSGCIPQCRICLYCSLYYIEEL